MARRRPVLKLLVGSGLVLTAEACTRKPATMPPSLPPTVEPLQQNSTDGMLLACTASEQYEASCINGECRVLMINTDVRTFLCQCVSSFMGKRCELPTLEVQAAEASVNVAVGVLVGSLLLVALVLLAVFYKRSRGKQKEASSQNHRCQMEDEEVREFLPGVAQFNEEETLARDTPIKLAFLTTPETTEVNKCTSNNQPTLPPLSAAAHVKNSDIPTPLIQEFHRFGFGRDGNSLRSIEQV